MGCTNVFLKICEFCLRSGCLGGDKNIVLQSIAELVDKGGIVAPAPKAGSVVIFDCNTLHASNGNITPFERMNAFFVFNAWSNRLEEPFAAPSARPEHIAHRKVEAPLKPLSKVTGRISNRES